MPADRVAGPMVQTILARLPPGKVWLLRCGELIEATVQDLDSGVELGDLADPGAPLSAGTEL